MKVPEPRKLSSGKWFIQLRLGGESIPVSGWDKAACIREARAVKAEYLAGRRVPVRAEPESPTLTSAIDDYLAAKDKILSPATVRGYRAIQKHRFAGEMQRKISDIADDEWQGIINRELCLVGATTVDKAFSFVRTVILHQTGHRIPTEHITHPAAPPVDTPFLLPSEILLFVEAVKDTQYAVPALLALSSLRMSEIDALRWENIPKRPKFIRVAGAVVRNEDNLWVKKEKNKNATSTRNLPIMIPELTAALERDRQPSGRVMRMNQNNLRIGVHNICKKLQITDVTVHGLRHSFASLAYHLQIPEKIAMEIGGWDDAATMHKIYTHIAKADITRYQTDMSRFYKEKGGPSKKNANKNANEAAKP